MCFCVVFLVQVAEAGVDPADVVVREDLLGVLVEHLEVAVRRRGLEVVVHVLGDVCCNIS